MLTWDELTIAEGAEMARLLGGTELPHYHYRRLENGGIEAAPIKPDAWSDYVEAAYEVFYHIDAEG